MEPASNGKIQPHIVLFQAGFTVFTVAINENLTKSASSYRDLRTYPAKFNLPYLST